MTALPINRAHLHRRYRDGASAITIVDECLARLAACDDPGIFIHTLPACRIREIAAALPPFDPLHCPLWGLPFAIKDNIDLAGVPTTAGCPAYAYTPTDSAPVVARLLAAGAIPIGKTNLDQFATGLVGVRTPHPIPRNAFDPARVPGGSSSGSAVAVARGIVAFALGTDTAGSGRIPAGLNNIVGLKPSVGLVSTRGVVPACRTLDCVSIFTLDVADARAVLDCVAGYDDRDHFARRVSLQSADTPVRRIAVPRPDDLAFFGDNHAAAAWTAAARRLAALDVEVAELDMTPFFAVARLLYEGPWVAERRAAVGRFLDTDAGAVHPVTRRILEGAARYSAVDTFEAFYRLAELRRQCERALADVDVLAVPTAPIFPRIADLEADPIGPNSRLGTYTNFVNLLDLAAIAVPGPFRRDDLPAGVTLIGRAGSDHVLARLAQRFFPGIGGVAEAATTTRSSRQTDRLEIAVVGAHMQGMPLNGELTRLGARLGRRTRTTADYRLYALAGGPPFRPGLLRVADGAGGPIDVEVWEIGAEGFGRLVAAIPAPLGIGTLRLADGTAPKGFLVEPEGLAGAKDITALGGWRAYVVGLAATA